MAANRSSRPRSGKKSPLPARFESGYREQTRRPLNCLVFLLPLLIVYEVGIFLAYPPFSDTLPPEVWAKLIIAWVIAVFGGTSYYLPGVVVVLTLLGWHLWRKDPWRVDKPALLGMGIESVVFAIPLLVYHAVLAASTRPTEMNDWADDLLLAMSAGIYEELVFRLLLISLLVFLLTDVARLKKPGLVEVLAVVISAVVFAGHHIAGLGGTEEFHWDRLLFRTLAGAYLGGVFVLRGFGIAVGSHTVFDVILASIR